MPATQHKNPPIRVTTFAGPGAEPVMREVPWPRIPPKGALIKIGACGVCGTDQHILKGHWPKPLPWPFTLGHELAGVIVEIGGELYVAQRANFLGHTVFVAPPAVVAVAVGAGLSRLGERTAGGKGGPSAQGRTVRARRIASCAPRQPGERNTRTAEWLRPPTPRRATAARAICMRGSAKCTPGGPILALLAVLFPAHLRWRILLRIRRFLRPTLRRPDPLRRLPMRVSPLGIEDGPRKRNIVRPNCVPATSSLFS